MSSSLKPTARTAADGVQAVADEQATAIAWCAQLPTKTLQKAALRFWGCRRFIKGLETAQPIVFNLTVWIEDYGLATEDAAKILHDLLAPGRMGNHRFASDLFADLDGEVKKMIAERDKQRREKEVSDDDARRGAAPRREQPY